MIFDISALKAAAIGAQNNRGTSLSDFEPTNLETLLWLVNKKTGEAVVALPSALRKGEAELHDFLFVAGKIGHTVTKDGLVDAVKGEIRRDVKALEAELVGRVATILTQAANSAGGIAGAIGGVVSAVEGAVGGLDANALAGEIVKAVASGLIGV